MPAFLDKSPLLARLMSGSASAWPRRRLGVRRLQLGGGRARAHLGGGDQPRQAGGTAFGAAARWRRAAVMAAPRSHAPAPGRPPPLGPRLHRLERRPLRCSPCGPTVACFASPPDSGRHDTPSLHRLRRAGRVLARLRAPPRAHRTRVVWVRVWVAALSTHRALMAHCCRHPAMAGAPRLPAELGRDRSPSRRSRPGMSHAPPVPVPPAVRSIADRHHMSTRTQHR